MAAEDLLNYSDLQLAVAKWLNRRDLTTMIPAFIKLAEDKITRRVRRRTVRGELSVSTESTALPADCAVLRSVYPRSSEVERDRPLENTTVEMFAEKRAYYGGVAGRPKVFTVVNGRELLVAPAPDDTYTLGVHYFSKLARLTDDNQTNDVLAEASDVYLYGALAEAEPYLKNDERIAIWKEKFDASIAELNHVREEEERSASISPARLPVVFG
jgi:hypothetical protein